MLVANAPAIHDPELCSTWRLMGEFELTAASRDGRREVIAMVIEDSANAAIRVTSPRRFAGIYAGGDLLGCLTVVRGRLEEEGLLICCQGARPLVAPSGMTRQMSNGRLAYPLRRSPPLTDADLVDIFAPAEL